MAPWTKKYKLSYQQVAQILEDFLEGKGKPLAWDGFTLGMSFADKYLEEIRVRCAGLSQEFPPDNPHHYCSEQGLSVIRDYVRRLKSLT